MPGSRMPRWSVMLLAGILALQACAAGQANTNPLPQGTLKPSGPVVIQGQHGATIQGVHITSASGDCVQIINSSDITIADAEIGPCGGNAVRISGGGPVNIYDSYIHPETLSPTCCDHNDGIFAVNTSQLFIQGNVIAFGESNIEVQGGASVAVVGNFLLNPRDEADSTHARGNNFQCWSRGPTGANCANVTVENNYALSSPDTTKYRYPEATQDSISFGRTDGFIAKHNYIRGGHSVAGCGLIADSRANGAQFLSNALVDTGQCGVAIADGTNQLVDGNRVLNRTPVAGSGNQAIYVWQSYGSSGVCGPVTVTNNVSTEYRPDGSQTGFWKGQGCDPLTLANNVFGQAADSMLTPLDQKLPPPLIPPQPKNCVVISPFSTQTGPACTASPR